MAVLFLGLFLWAMGHLIQRILPAERAAMGAKGRKAAALVIGLGLLLMVLGFLQAPVVWVYTPPDWARHANNALMLAAIYLFGIGKSGSLMRTRIRHPMLLGVLLWAVAHLLANGDLAGIVLFGGLALWAVVEILVINKSGPWTRPPPGQLRGDMANLAVTLVLYALIGWVHIWFGRMPFGTGL